MEKTKVVIVGGTGYLGQHLLQAFAGNNGCDLYDVAFTHHSSPLPRRLLDAFPHFPAFPVDLKSGLGFNSISQDFGQPDVVVNCAALSVPRACEQDPDSAMSINVPTSLVNWLSTFERNKTLLIHLSTDQVYEGVKSFYKEEDETVAVNVYGKSKVAAELLIKDKCQNFAILRSSIIVGPQTVSPLPKTLPIQWIDSSLKKGDTVEFFHDEFRCPIYVKDLVNITLKLIDRWVVSDEKQMQLVLNAGGPERLSRVQMAQVVAEVRGYDMSLIKHVSASSVDRGVVSPADISMDITKLIQTLEISPTSFKDGVRLTLESESHILP
ncbi:NAD(P)-binding domain superfamily [Arabidopsis thaliana x Arabidopsis arenosa]|uniref:NAD(P)-binding domain superfamily n=1 Tax=Arabidopsis thaliana x Arabidopsis arenosa TaxID=1240361 RepID=A0A8T1Z5E3_9BRAS|nr:NAD(P)-binding domain superfamily [Arabidopsis thaliana x Arabidopsis arenosa]